MPRPRFQYAAEQKREALLEAATFEFGSQGYEDASINRILVAAGFSKGSFYYYFDDKADLAVAVLERWAQRYEQVWDDVGIPTTREDFWAVAEEVLARSTAQLREEPQVTAEAMMRLGTALASHADARERLANGAVTGMMTKVAAFWARGQELGAVREDLSVQQLLVLVRELKLALVQILLPHDRVATMDEVETFSRLHLDLVRRVTAGPEPVFRRPAGHPSGQKARKSRLAPSQNSTRRRAR